jgi:hypothetical protein
MHLSIEGAAHYAPLDCTVSATHSIYADGLKKALVALGWTAANGWPLSGDRTNKDWQIPYYWVVPEERFTHGWTKAQVSSAPKTTTDTDIQPNARDASTLGESIQQGGSSHTTPTATKQNGAESVIFANLSEKVLRIPRAVAISRLQAVLDKQGVKHPLEYVASYK